MINDRQNNGTIHHCTEYHNNSDKSIDCQWYSQNEHDISRIYEEQCKQHVKD